MNPLQREAGGLQIRYAETEGGGDETVLLLNPWPESLFAWNTIWSRLAENARLIAIDLPGFGQSERRAELLSPRGGSRRQDGLLGPVCGGNEYLSEWPHCWRLDGLQRPQRSVLRNRLP